MGWNNGASAPTQISEICATCICICVWLEFCVEAEEGSNKVGWSTGDQLSTPSSAFGVHFKSTLCLCTLRPLVDRASFSGLAKDHSQKMLPSRRRCSWVVVVVVAATPRWAGMGGTIVPPGVVIAVAVVGG